MAAVLYSGSADVVCFTVMQSVVCSARAVTWPPCVDFYAIDRLFSAGCDLAGVIYAASE